MNHSNHTIDDNLSVNDNNNDNEPSITSELQDIELKQMIPLYISDKDNLKCAHLNVNSVRYKIGPLAQLLEKGLLDILSLQETKLDPSFPEHQFKLDGFKCHRKDYKCNAGGLMLYIRNDIAQRRRTDIEIDNDDNNGRIESVCVELYIRSQKWLLVSMYKQPVVKDKFLCSAMEKLIDTISNECENYIIVGDLNVDMSKSNPLQDLIDTEGCRNIVKDPTCFKGQPPSIIDLVITNVHKRIRRVVCIDIDLSDFHHMIYFSTKLYVPIRRNRKVMYRSYKNFNLENYNSDLAQAPFHVGEIFEDYDDMYYFNETLMRDIIDSHAPVKYRKIKHNNVPYMNNELRKCINVKNMLRRKYYRNKTNANWLLFRNARNHVTKLRKLSIGKYIEKCSQNAGSTMFWKSVKPLISDKGCDRDNITLLENDVITNKPEEVSEILNNYFVNMACDIGSSSNNNAICEQDSLFDIISEYENHPSCIFIKNKNLSKSRFFDLQLVSTDTVRRELKNLNPKKAVGHDRIPPKLLKLGADNLCRPIQYMVNRSISDQIFPDSAKKAEVTPIFKKNDNLDKNNYRPVSVLTSMSKMFEKIIVNQLVSYFNDIFSPKLSGFRKKHGCQDVILDFVEKNKNDVDNNKIVCAVLTDLSKAFDCLPHRLLVAKMHFYGVSDNSCKLIMSYFSNRKQRVKLCNNTVKSEWLDIFKGSPQGSVFGPFSYNMFSNDLLELLSEYVNIYNYADDNTISCNGLSIAEAKEKMSIGLDVMIDWFHNNGLKANPEKFQLIFFGRNCNSENEELIFKNNTINGKNTVKLLGVHIDQKLEFTVHVSEICRKAGYKLNVLQRISRNLNIQGSLILMHSFILSFFNFCSIAWHFCNISSSRKIEKIQARALKIIYKEYNVSYEELRTLSCIPLVYVQRLRRILDEIYKCYHKINPSYLHSLIEPKENVDFLRNSNILTIPRFNTVTYGINSFTYQGATLWNGLDNNIKSLDHKKFKQAISEWIPVCECSTCIFCKLSNM